MSPAPTPVELEEPTVDTTISPDRPWVVIVWNDPINLMSYVVFVFMRVLGFNKEKATRHMREVHERGRSLVASETRERAELYHQQIQSHGLIVTLEQSS